MYRDKILCFEAKYFSCAYDTALYINRLSACKNSSLLNDMFCHPKQYGLGMGHKWIINLVAN